MPEKMKRAMATPNGAPAKITLTIDPVTQARRAAATRAFHDRAHAAYHQLKGPDAPCQPCESRS